MSKTIYVAARFPETMVQGIDAYAAERTEEGMEVTRSDALRLLVARGLDAVGRCCAVKGDFVCTMHKGHKGTHFDSHKDKSWK
jgi:hypothetical protein